MPEIQSDLRLAAAYGLGLAEPVAETWPQFSMTEIAGLSVWWLSVSAQGLAALDKACDKQFATALPDRHRFAEGGTGDNKVRILWAGDRQWFITGSFGEIPTAIAGAGWATDQSDGWIAIRLEGARTRQVMEKLCGLDLHPSVFPTGATARAPMEGMIALIACEDAEAGTFVVHFQRSSARSFLEHVRHAAHSTSPRA